MNEIRKPGPEDIEKSMSLDKKQRDYPTITEEQYQDLHDYRTGRDSFVEFQGFVLSEDGTKSGFKDIYRIHDDFPELGPLRNFSLTLRGIGSNLPGGEKNKSMVDFTGYGIGASIGRPFQEMPVEESESMAIAKSTPKAEREGALAVKDLASFHIMPNQSIEQREAARELLCKFTRRCLEEILSKKTEKTDLEELERTVSKNLLEEYLDEFKEKGIYRIFTSEGFIDLRDESTFKL